MEEGQLYDVDVYVSMKDWNEFFGHANPRKTPPIEKATPVWQLRSIPYSLDAEPGTWNTTVDIDLDLLERQVLSDKNQTMWVHVRVKTENPLLRA